MKAVLDENLPPALARALHELACVDDHSVQHVTQIVPMGSTDLAVFEAISVAKIGVHVTQDHHHRKPVERHAIAASGLIVFVLNKGWSEQNFWDKSANLIRWWPAIIAHAERMTPPAVFRVPWKLQGKGKFEQVPMHALKKGSSKP